MTTHNAIRAEVVARFSLLRILGKREKASTVELSRDPFATVMNSIGIRRLPVDMGTRFTLSLKCPTPAVPARNGGKPDEIPIDDYLGLFDAESLDEVLFASNVRKFAEQLDVAPEDLAQIVRLHEAAHAMLLLGCLNAEFDGYAEASLNGAGQEVLERRRAVLRQMEDDAHEKFAQLCTWIAIQNHARDDEREGFERTFRLLLARQPERYQIEGDILDAIAREPSAAASAMRSIMWVIWGDLDQASEGIAVTAEEVVGLVHRGVSGGESTVVVNGRHLG